MVGSLFVSTDWKTCKTSEKTRNAKGHTREVKTEGEANTDGKILQASAEQHSCTLNNCMVRSLSFLYWSVPSDSRS